MGYPLIHHSLVYLTSLRGNRIQKIHFNTLHKHLLAFTRVPRISAFLPSTITLLLSMHNVYWIVFFNL